MSQLACLKVRRSAHWYSRQKMREHACNLVTGVLGVILRGVCLKVDKRLNTALLALTS